jgi:hypothetical protein
MHARLDRGAFISFEERLVELLISGALAAPLLHTACSLGGLQLQN